MRALALILLAAVGIGASTLTGREDVDISFDVSNYTTVYDSVLDVTTTVCEVDGPLENFGGSLTNSAGTNSVLLNDGPWAGCSGGSAWISQLILKPGSNTFTVEITDTYWSTSYGYLTVIYEAPEPPEPTVVLEPEADTTNANPGATLYQRFHVLNPRDGSTTYSFSTQCTGSATCVSTPSNITFSDSGSADVRVGYSVAGSIASVGTIRLIATEVGDAANKDTAFSRARVLPSGPVVERGSCVNVALGGAASSECGALRILHSLPAVRTYGRDRALALTYLSEQAHPHPIITVPATLASGPTPDGIVTSATIGGQTYYDTVAASQFSPMDTTRRAMVSFDGLALATGLHPYTYEVRKFTGGVSQVLTSGTDTLSVVNRSASAFGAGWSLAGIEELHALTGDRFFWVGGDGSSRVYEKMATVSGNDVYLAPQVSGADTLLKSTSTGTFQRRIRGGGYVGFDSQRRQVSTVSILGHTTTFEYDAKGRLWKVTVPPSTAGLVYEVAYVDTSVTSKVASITVPDGLVSTTRVTTLTMDAGRLASITDPDTTTVSFTYDTVTTRLIRARTDRRGNPVLFAYDSAQRITSRTLLVSGQVSTLTVCAAESQGMTACAPDLPRPVDVRTVINGPLSDSPTPDVTSLWVNASGVWKTQSPLGAISQLYREDARFPALVTRTVESVTGRTSAAEYDYRGNPLAVTDSSHTTGAGGTLRYATSRYEWHPQFNQPTRVLSPEGTETVVGYNVTTGTIAWTEDGRGLDSRTAYRYTAQHLPRAIVHPGGAKDSIEYDSDRFNVSRTITPLGRTRSFRTDLIGRTTYARTLINFGDTLTQDDSTAYTKAGRVAWTIGYGPDVHGAGAQQVSVTYAYDEEGNVEGITRGHWPQPNDIGALTSVWFFNEAGLAVKSLQPDGAKDSTVYDVAGRTIRTISSRGDTIWTEFDVAGNLTRRITYSAIDTTFRLGAASVNVAHAQNPAYGGYVIPRDTTTFSYDSLGRLVDAQNADARVKRRYTAWGAVLTDSQFIAHWDRSAMHAYGIAHTYDLEGRTTNVYYPEQLVGGTQYRAEYSYNDTTGLLRKVRGLQNETFDFTYNFRNQLTKVDMPGGIEELNTFDNDGFLSTHKLLNDTPGGLADRYPDTWFEQSTMTYDAVGRRRTLVNTDGLESTDSATYSGLGHLRRHYQDVSGTNTMGQTVLLTAEEIYSRDALGHVGASSQAFASNATTGLYYNVHQSSSTPRTYDYDIYSGRLTEQRSFSLGREVIQSFVYDAKGNTTWSGMFSLGSSESAWRRYDDRISYYDAIGRVRHAEKRFWVQPDGYPIAEARLWRYRDTYRYDPLGRRVLVRTENGCFNLGSIANPHCDISVVRRTVWNGSMELMEIQRPASGMPVDAGDTATVAMMESDTATLALAVRHTNPWGFGYYHQWLDPSRLFGRVAYTHGTSIDRPLSVTRLGYVAREMDVETEMQIKSWSPFTIVPHWSARGVAQGGTFANGAVFHRLTVPLDEYDVSVDVLWNTDGPAFDRLRPDSIVAWHGTLIDEKYDNVGTMYRRNRQYDPATGQFTQPDPIGLAGGLNLYGYAGGDPINFSDPFGLCPLCIGWAVVEAAMSVADAVDLGITAAKFVAGRASRAELGVTAAGAAAGLVAPGGGLGRGGRLALNASESWGSAGTLARHFRDHGAEVGARSATEYADMASDFLQRGLRDGLPTKVDANGVIRVYDPSTNTFGAFNPDGTTRTFFKPTSKTYWDRQPGTTPP